MSDRGEKSKGKGLKIDNSEDDNSSDSEHGRDREQDNKLMENTVSNVVALQKSQPMKRGLSSHYYGRSRSFGDLLAIKINDISELGKEEDSLNKKRRLIRSHDDLDIGTRRTPTLDRGNPIQGLPTFDYMVTKALDSIFASGPSNDAAAENEDNIMDLDSIFALLPSNNAAAENEDNVRMDDLSDGRNEVGCEDITLDDLDRVLETEDNHEDGISLDDLNGELKFEYDYEDCLTLDDLNDGNFYVGLGHVDIAQIIENRNSNDDQSDGGKKDDEHDHADEENKEIHNGGDDQSDKGKKDDEHDHDDEENKEVHNSADDQSDKGKKDDEHDHDDEENKEVHNSADDQSDKGKKDDEHDHDDEENKEVHNSADGQSDKGKKDDEHDHDADDEENKEISPKST